MEKYTSEHLGELSVQRKSQQLGLDDLLWGYNAVSLYPSAMWDEETISRWIEMGFAYTKDMKNELVEKFNTGNFNKGGAILKTKLYNLKNLIFQHLPVKEKV